MWVLRNYERLWTGVCGLQVGAGGLGSGSSAAYNDPYRAKSTSTSMNMLAQTLVVGTHFSLFYVCLRTVGRRIKVRNDGRSSFRRDCFCFFQPVVPGVWYLIGRFGFSRSLLLRCSRDLSCTMEGSGEHKNWCHQHRLDFPSFIAPRSNREAFSGIPHRSRKPARYLTEYTCTRRAGGDTGTGDDFHP